MMNTRVSTGLVETAAERSGGRWLKRIFLVGAVMDALALIPLMHPQVADLLWEIPPGDATQEFVSHCAAALMLGWTVLLCWASRRPVERRDIAPITVVAIIGLWLAESAAVLAGAIPHERMVPTWILQAALIVSFSWAYMKSRPRTEE